MRTVGLVFKKEIKNDNIVKDDKKEKDNKTGKKDDKNGKVQE